MVLQKQWSTYGLEVCILIRSEYFYWDNLQNASHNRLLCLIEEYWGDEYALHNGLCKIATLSDANWWSVVLICTNWDVYRPIVTLFLCSETCPRSTRLVSPMYWALQSLQLIWYIALGLSSGLCSSVAFDNLDRQFYIVALSHSVYSFHCSSYTRGRYVVNRLILLAVIWSLRLYDCLTYLVNKRGCSLCLRSYSTCIFFFSELFITRTQLGSSLHQRSCCTWLAGRWVVATMSWISLKGNRCIFKSRNGRLPPDSYSTVNYIAGLMYLFKVSTEVSGTAMLMLSS